MSAARPSLHRPPRYPHAWIGAAVVLHLVVVAAWWRWGWSAGLASLVVAHLVFVWGTLRPGSRLFGPVVTRFPAGAPEVWLTIDDGPSDDTPAILDLLDAHGAKATFFLVGERARARPDLVRRIVERGHGIGNHSHTHPQARFWCLGPRALRREVLDAQAVLAGITGQPPRWFRAVVGHANPFLHAPLREAGLSRLAWSARGYDAVYRDPERVAAAIERGLAPGAIILMHEGAPHGRSVAMIGSVLERLAARGYIAVVPEGCAGEAPSGRLSAGPRPASC